MKIYILYRYGKARHSIKYEVNRSLVRVVCSSVRIENGLVEVNIFSLSLVRKSFLVILRKFFEFKSRISGSESSGISKSSRFINLTRHR